MPRGCMAAALSASSSLPENRSLTKSYRPKNAMEAILVRKYAFFHMFMRRSPSGTGMASIRFFSAAGTSRRMALSCAAGGKGCPVEASAQARRNPAMDPPSAMSCEMLWGHGVWGGVSMGFERETGTVCDASAILATARGWLYHTQRTHLPDSHGVLDGLVHVAPPRAALEGHVLALGVGALNNKRRQEGGMV